VATEQVGELLADMVKVEQGAPVFEVDEEVDVAVWFGLAAGDAAEDPYAGAMVARCDYLPAMLHQQRPDCRGRIDGGHATSKRTDMRRGIIAAARLGR